jgi:1-acyl-sn-glycerol-3-phosphate acyltransferase
MRTCLEVITAGEPLVMFPEGSRQFGPEIQPLFDGPAFVQSRTGAPIVPVGIGGSERAMPKGARFIRPHRITVVIGPPLEATPAADGGGAKARRSAIHARTAELATVLQDLFDQAQAQAGTPNR